MLSFRNTLRENDPEVIAQIASSTGFFDDKDVNEKNSMEPIVSEWQKMELS